MDKVGKQNSWISCLLVSAHCHLRVRDCSESFVFKYCHTAHVACTFAELWRRLITVRKKELKDSSNHVKSGYAAMIKLESELSKQGQCLFDWSMLCPL